MIPLINFCLILLSHFCKSSSVLRDVCNMTSKPTSSALAVIACNTSEKNGLPAVVFAERVDITIIASNPEEVSARASLLG